MALAHVNPTRMELTKLKNQLAVTRRGHRLLKDKQDELIRQFMELVFETKNLRSEVEKHLEKTLKEFNKGRLKLKPSELIELTSVPLFNWYLETEKVKAMTVESLRLDLTFDDNINLPFSLSNVPLEFDEAFLLGKTLIPLLISLAEAEKKTELYALEIEKTRRRVNAIEHIMIPEQEALIKDIQTKLADQELAATIRVMKSKEMIIKKTLLQQKNK